MTAPSTSQTPATTPVPTGLRVAPRTVVASLWLFATLNYLYCDVLGTHDPQYLKALLTGTVGGIEMNQGFLLAASVLVSIPMSSVLVSRVAPHRLARIWSIAAGAVMTVVQLGTLGVGSTPTMYYLYFSAIEVATTAFIVWFAVTRWRVDS